jgi:UDP-N-acetylmuramoyl-tripeptide--D-alanyl-D-alanine ligase
MQINELEQGLGTPSLSKVEESFSGIGTDTRLSLKGKIFFALRGDRFDAHDYLNQAIEQDAAALVIDRPPKDIEILKSKITIVQVDDTLKALQKLANYWRKKINPKVVAISGSAGKTTTKEFCAQMLKNHFKIYWSPGSFNNHWGVPLSLLQLEPGHEVMIQEMGMSHRGELKELCEVAEPDVVLVTNVGSAHVGELGSIEEVAKAKEELYLHSPNATGIYNISNEWTMQMFEKYKSQQNTCFTFSSFSSAANIQMRVEKTSLDSILVSGRIGAVNGLCKVSVFGRHNVHNIMGASAIALSLGLSPQEIWSAIPNCLGAWGRNELYKHPCGASIVFDAYNANPESMSALVKNIYEMERSGEPRIIFGEMLELGDQRSEHHFELGKLVASCGFRWVSFMGESYKDFQKGLESSGYKGKSLLYADYDEAVVDELDKVIQPEDWVLVKASRGIALERVLKRWGIG